MDFFFKSTFSTESFRNTIRVSNSLDPDQARQNAGPDLNPNCLQRLSADDKSDSGIFSQFLHKSMLWILMSTYDAQHTKRALTQFADNIGLDQRVHLCYSIH